MKSTDILVHYSEIATKGRNRKKFIDVLERNIRLAMRGLPVSKIKRPPGRIWISSHPDAHFDEEALKRLSKVYGISSFSPVVRSTLELDDMKAVAWDLMKDKKYDSFRVRARRSFKEQPLDSMTVNREVGAHILINRDSNVKMKNADVTVHIEMVASTSYIYTDKYPGPGGLPVGVSGNLTVMLSGGIDSPVAAARMQQRGCALSFVHFHSHPFVSRASIEKAEELGEILAQYQYEGVIHMVPFGELQREIVTNTPEGLRVVLYRRFMVRIAAALAKREKARALVTGEALGQVASQTLTNLITVDQASPLPILRPLVGFDKHEIIEHAERLGSFEISIVPDQDCCQLFMPKNPETHAKLERVLEAEKKLDLDRLCEETLAKTEVVHIRAPWWSEKKKKRKPRLPVSVEEIAVVEHDEGNDGTCALPISA